MKPILVLLLAPSVVLAAPYNPGGDRAAFKQHAAAAYDSAANAAGRPLEPEKIPVIKADLDESLAQARLAATSAYSLETAGFLRAEEMDKLLKGKNGEAPDAAAKALTDTAAAARARWKNLAAKYQELKAKVDALPDNKPDGKPNEEKSRLKDSLEKVASLLAGADADLIPAEAGATAMAAAAEQMKTVRHHSLGPAAERKQADDEAQELSRDLPPPMNEAKAAVDLIGQEPQASNRTRAGDKLGVPRDMTRRLLAAADRAGNRDGDFAGDSAAFERAKSAFEDAKRSADGKTEAAKPLLDQAEDGLIDVRSRLAHN